VIRIIANTTTLDGMLRRVIGRLEQPEQALRAVGNLIYSLTLGAFDLDIGQRPAAWPPRRDGTPGTLYKTGALRHSLRLSVGPQSAMITTDRPYAAIHQFGGITRPHAIRPRARQRPAVVFRRPAPARHRFPRAAGSARAPGGSLSLRTAGTPSLPWDLVGGAQSPVPDILADREDAVPPNLSELARVFSDWLALQVRRRAEGDAFTRDGRGLGSVPGGLVRLQQPLNMPV